MSGRRGVILVDNRHDDCSFSSHGSSVRAITAVVVVAVVVVAVAARHGGFRGWVVIEGG